MLNLSNEEKEVRKNYTKIRGLQKPLMLSFAEMEDDGRKLINLLIDKYPIDKQMLPFLSTVTMLKGIAREYDSIGIYPKVFSGFILIKAYRGYQIRYFVVHLGSNETVLEVEDTKSNIRLWRYPTPTSEGSMMEFGTCDGFGKIVCVNEGKIQQGEFHHWEEQQKKELLTLGNTSNNPDIAEENWKKLDKNKVSEAGPEMVYLGHSQDKWVEYVFKVRKDDCELEEGGPRGGYHWEEEWAVAISPNCTVYVYKKRT